MSSASTGGTEGSSPASSPASASSLAMAAPKFGTLVPNRIFVGGISASTSEAELAQLFSAYGNVKATKIISDRAGVSKGYGFVTFETDAEARRLQQESECIILRERKLNIAPAIKKQPFNRSFDGGSGSPPAVPTSTYYYTNGMGLTYQNGLTFYNTGAPAPGTPIVPPTDPTIYTPAGVFGPQATSGHQTFAPVVYSCPAPSLYMPQQYQYSPMTYESYYTGAAGGGGGPPQYALYTASATGGNQQQQHSQQSQNNGSVAGSGGGSSVSGGSGIGGTGTGAASPPALTSMPPPPTHFYAPSAPPPPPPHHHHHPPVAAGPPPPPHPQLDHLYYSFAAPGPPPVQPQQQHQTIGIGDQQLLLYTTDPTSCQQLNPTSDSQPSAQEDTRSTSSHSDHPQQHSDTQPQQNQQSPLSTTPLMSLMPIKYPIMSARYANYHPLAMHPGNLQQSHHTLNQHASQTLANGGTAQNPLNSEQTEDSGNPSHLQRSQTASTPAYLYPATVYIPHGTSYPTTTGPTVGASLLPTPGTSYDAPLKIHKNATISGKPSGLGSAALGINLGYHRTHNNYSIFGGIQQQQQHQQQQQQQSYAKSQGYPRKYGSYQGALNTGERGRYYGTKSGPSLSQQYSYVNPRPGIFGNQILTNSSNFGANTSTTPSYNGQSYGNPRRNSSDQWSDSYDGSFRYGNSRRRDSSIHSRSGRNPSRDDAHETEAKTCVDSRAVSGDARVNDENPTKAAISVTDRNNKSSGSISNNNNNSPPPAPYSPMTRPIPNISPPISQVQIYPSGGQVQNRYQHLQMSHHQQQQHQQSGQRRYGGIGQSMNSGRKPPGSGSQVGQGTGEILRRPKSKVNGLMQGGIVVKHQDDNCLGGGGDATGSNMSRMPITPPSTPRNNTTSTIGNNDSNPISDACHQMQALTL